MLKASWGGGGRGMRPVVDENELSSKILEGRREAQSAFGNDEGYLEKLIQSARHVEVQILGDKFGTTFHLWERDCSVQRRNQKVVERAPAPYLDDVQREELCGYAKAICSKVGYYCAGTVDRPSPPRCHHPRRCPCLSLRHRAPPPPACTCGYTRHRTSTRYSATMGPRVT